MKKLTSKKEPTLPKCRWNTVKWKEIQMTVFKWQRQIYSASKTDDIKQVRKIQHLLLNSTAAKLLAVRRVTQDNQGKSTAGVDGIKNIPPNQRLEMAATLQIPTKAQPLRRVWIPKPGKFEKRPLGIPTIKDRCLQALLKLALEPEWEAKFEPNSYGFRPGRNAHDAITAIKNCVQKKSKYVLDADIAKCFDEIDHEALLNKIGMRGKYRKQIKNWLESGILDSGTFAETTKGTPQGGIISPLLANIALHGMETHLKNSIQHIPIYYSSGRNKVRPSKAHQTLHVIRYADDFVILHDNLEVILHCKQEIQIFLARVGLKLSSAKTRMSHTLKFNEGDLAKLGGDERIGFNFLGFTIKQFESRHRSARNRNKKIGYKTLIYPSTESCKKHQEKLHKIVLKESKSLDQETLISRLNPIIRGWANYFGISHANTTGHLGKQDYLLYLKLRKWALRNKGTAGKAASYWRTSKNRKWCFGTSEGILLLDHITYARPIGAPDGYVKVKGESSPFDENQIYWTKRLTMNPLFGAHTCNEFAEKTKRNMQPMQIEFPRLRYNGSRS